MRDGALDSAREHMYGTQEAARYLGVHRSTLHLAVRQGLVVPDERTPGGHVRFSKDTLNRFREHLASGSATGEESTLAPLRAQSTVAHLLAMKPTTNLREIGAEVVSRVCAVLHNIDACCVARSFPEPHERAVFRMVAQQGFPDPVLTAFVRMQAAHTFAATTVLRTLQPEFRDDVAQQQMHAGTAWLSRTWPIGAYAVLPIIVGEEALGVLVCVSHYPRHFSRQDVVFLQGMADLLAIAFDSARGPHMRTPTISITSTIQLMRLALDLRAGAVDSGILAQNTYRPSLERISPLVDTFLRLSGAQDVCALGFDTIVPTRDPRLAGLACGACAEENSTRVLREEWDENDIHHIALATSIPLHVSLPARRDTGAPGMGGVWRGAVVARWCGAHVPPEGEDLLATFACAYLLALS